jgi:hypothetical protein
MRPNGKTLHEVADAINALFDRYGLDHPVVAVKETLPIRLDVRENEPDPMKWRAAERAMPADCIVLENCDDVPAMELLLTTLTYIFDVYFEVQPPSEQRRLF